MVASFLYDHTKSAQPGAPLPSDPVWTTVPTAYVFIEKQEKYYYVDIPSYLELCLLHHKSDCSSVIQQTTVMYLPETLGLLCPLPYL